MPEFLEAQVAASRAHTIDDLPYRIEQVLHFSNGGGVYLARRRVDGVPVVLKEARPFAGLDAEHDDAVTRLGREERALRKLDGVLGIPRLYEAFSAWEHRSVQTGLTARSGGRGDRGDRP